jgi:transposase-like protein
MKKADPNPLILALEVAASDEEAAILYFEAARWGDAPVCPECGSRDVYAMKDETGEKREKNYRWRCHACKAKYSVRTGSIFEETRLPMKVWAHAMWRVCASKKGVSALQIKRETQISYKSALYLLHRIRHAMGDGGTFDPIGGEDKVVEADSTYVGGRPRNRGAKYGNKRGRGTKKIQVHALVERGGEMRYTHVGRLTSRQITQSLLSTIDPRSRLCTDEDQAYIAAGGEMAGGHGTTNHRARQYAKPDGTHSNTAESAFSLLKRGVYGTFHSVSPTHLHRYLCEFEFRWNTRFLDDGARTLAAVRAAEGKRLMYREPPKQEREAG